MRVTQKVHLIQITLKHSQGNRDTWKKSKYLPLFSYIASLQRGVRGLAGVWFEYRMRPLKFGKRHRQFTLKFNFIIICFCPLLNGQHNPADQWKYNYMIKIWKRRTKENYKNLWKKEIIFKNLKTHQSRLIIYRQRQIFTLLNISCYTLFLHESRLLYPHGYRGHVSKETVLLHQWGLLWDNLVLWTELIM